MFKVCTNNTDTVIVQLLYHAIGCIDLATSYCV